MTTISLATNYIFQVKLIRNLELELKKLKEGRDALESQLLAAFREEGVQSIKTAEGLAYLRRDLWASLNNGAESLIDTELAWLVKPHVNQQSLSAVVREWERDDQDMPIVPEEVKGSIKVSEVFKVGVRI